MAVKTTSVNGDRFVTRQHHAKSNSGIRIKPANKGKLHATLGVAKSKRIPAAALAKAKSSPDPLTRKRATFAINARKWAHSKG